MKKLDFGSLVGVLIVVFALAAASRGAEPAKSPVKIFILAGQSNMEGHAKVALLKYQIDQPATHEQFKHLQKDGQWVQRDDVWIKFLDRKGKLTVGYGSPDCIGPELGFGNVVGDHFHQPVILVKTAWGGRSLYRDFRPPSAALPPQKDLDKMLADMRKKNPSASIDDVKATFGKAYRDTLSEVNAVLADPKSVYPEYSGQGCELAGFVWFQGWNDMINAEYTAQYASNLACFIRDVRKDLKSPSLPFVIGQMGVDGDSPEANVRKFKDAEAAVLEMPEFKGNVRLVKTDAFWDKDAAAVFKKGWRENIAEWNKVGSDFPYHYLGSVKTMLAIGNAFGNAIIEMQNNL